MRGDKTCPCIKCLDRVGHIGGETKSDPIVPCRIA